MSPPPVTSGLILDLRADQMTGLVDGQAAASWSDLSGGGHNAAAYGTVTYKSARTPTGKPSMLFDQSGYFTLNAGAIWSGTTASDLFVIAKATVFANQGSYFGNMFQEYQNPAAYGEPYGGGTSARDAVFANNGINFATSALGGGGVDITAWNLVNTYYQPIVAPDGGQYLVINQVAQGRDSQVYQQPTGTLPLGSTCQTWATYTAFAAGTPIPATSRWQGELAAVLAYNRQLTTAERASVSDWLTATYLVPASAGTADAPAASVLTSTGAAGVAPVPDTFGTGPYGGGFYGGGAPEPVWSWAGLAEAPAPAQQLVIGPWRTGPDRELAQVSGRKLMLNLREPSTISFDVTGYPDPDTGRFDARLLAEGVSDVLWRRGGRQLLLARLTQATDRVAASGHTVSCTCTDYRGLLDRRLIYQDTTGPLAGSGKKSFPDSTPLADIAWALIADTQAQVGGSLGLTKGLWPAGTPIYATGFEIPDGDTVLAALQRLAAPGPVSIVSSVRDHDTQLDVVMANLPGFDWDIDPQRRVNMYYSFRGADNGVKLDYAAGYGGAITSISRSLDLTNYANVIRQSGGDELARNPVLLPAPDIAARPEGRWEVSVSDTNVLTPDTLRGAAAKSFDLYAKLQPTYDLTLAPGVYDPATIGLGDVITIAIDSGRLQVNDKLRVTSISIELDSSDRETVTLTVGRPKPDVLKFLSTSVRDLNRR